MKLMVLREKRIVEGVPFDMPDDPIILSVEWTGYNTVKDGEDIEHYTISYIETLAR